MCSISFYNLPIPKFFFCKKISPYKAKKWDFSQDLATLLPAKFVALLWGYDRIYTAQDKLLLMKGGFFVNNHLQYFYAIVRCGSFTAPAAISPIG